VKPANGSAAAHKFGFDTAASMLGLDGSAIDARTIAELDGTLWEWTGVSLELIFVRSGAPQPGEGRVGMGTNEGRLDRWFFRYRLRATVAIATVDGATGSFAMLGAYGMPGGGRWPTRAPSHRAVVRRSYDRNINWRSKEIIYVEGCQEPSVWAGMSLATFCAENKKKGDFMVVVASLRST
jgi:hypothetical protein